MTEDETTNISLDVPGSGLYLFSSNEPPVWVTTRELFESYGALLQELAVKKIYK